MRKTYSGASFSTSGKWIIPLLLGFSKSVVAFGQQPIGIMYTLHITPYLNLGFNNPNPKIKRETKSCDCKGCGYCEELDEQYFSPEQDKLDIALDQAHDFLFNANSDQVFGCYPTFEGEEDNLTTITFLVSDLSVEIPDEFNGYKTKKEVSTQPIAHNHDGSK